jgi:hypothetical protein
MLQETSQFADSIDRLMRATLNVEDEEFDPEFEEFPEAKQDTEETETEQTEEEEIDGDLEEHDEL